MKVLIIDDNDDYIKKAANVIKKLGYEAINPEATKSIEQAIEFIRAYDAEAILLDMNYGEEYYSDYRADGCRVAAQLTAEECQKIICASGTPDVYEKYLRPLGVKHFGGKQNFAKCLTNNCKCK